MSALELVANNSDKLSNIALLTVAASLAAIFSTNYRRPNREWVLKSYYLLPFSWLSLALCLYYGDIIHRRLIAANYAMINDDRTTMLKISEAINENYPIQNFYLNFGIFLVVIWSLFYLYDFIEKKSE